MSSRHPALHVYERTIDQRERSSLSVIASQIPPNARILDLGCGSGAIGQHLAQSGPVTIDGLTISNDEAQLARRVYRRVAVANLDDCDLVALFGMGQYDVIVCADVLEHVRGSERVLAQCAMLLAPGGKALLSIPNASYSGLIAELMAGEFRYRKEGLLDETHVRFFTRQTLLRFLHAGGWAVDRFETIDRALPESEFQVAFDAMPPSVARHLLALPDAQSYQFIVSTHPQPGAKLADQFLSGGAASTAREATLLPAQALYSAQLYWDNGDGYAENRKRVQAGVIGQGQQTLQFRLPAGTGARQLKLDPADRPGILHLYSLVLREAASGQTVWQWHMREGGAALLQTLQSQQMAWGVIADGAALSAVLCGDDPWLKLPIDPDTLTQAAASGELLLDVTLGWPMSADYLSLVGMLAPLQAEQTLLRAQAGRVSEVLADHEKLALEHAQLHRLHAELHRELAQEQSERRHLFADRNRTRLEAANLRAELNGMAEHVHNLSNLRSVRYGQTLSALLRPGRASALAMPPVPPTAPNMDQLTPLNNDTEKKEPQFEAPAPAPLSDTVDVIVPVYKGLADTQLCLESVLASAVSTPYRLIVINDCSPEPEVTSWLRLKAAQEPRITLLENEVNLGFVGTVNRGMKHATAHDVLLLNSDTEVANDWLDRLRRAAYASAKVASVTPFSSNATICSYPVFCAANPVPQGETTASLDALFAQANAGQVVDVPTGVGFCMYIRRDSLNDVGFFDEEHFGKGYGEENDFCQRAQAKGWRNLHALDCYVLHTGGVSFGESKSPREQAAMRILAKLHPAYDAQVQAFVLADPAAPARLAVDWLRATGHGATRKPVVLAVQHQRGGGTERHVIELARTLADRVTFVSLKPAGAHHVELQLIEQTDPVGDPSQSAAKLDAQTATWGLSQRMRAVLGLGDELPTLLQLLRTLGVAHVHYHHLLGHHQVVWDLPRLLGVSYDFTSHDFYSHCTHITLTGNDNRYHALDEHGECCGGAHPPSQPHVAEQIDDWRARNRAFLEGARHVLAPSLDTASRMRRAYPTAPVRFAPHTDVDPSQLPAPSPRGLTAQRPLRVVVIGALSIIKGADVLERTARLARQTGTPVEFHLIGFGYRHLQTAPGAALTVYGQYEEADLPALLQRIGPDVAWFPALWPETYSYTLSAALQAGLPVVVPDLGAFAERVAQRPWSWVQAWDSTPEQWLALFSRVRAHLLDAGPADIASQPTAATPMAPALRGDLAELAAAQGDWDYVRDYPVPPLPHTVHPAHPMDAPEPGSATPAAQAATTADWAQAHELGQFFAQAQRRNPPPEAARSGLYGLALRLQRAPMLGPLMRAMPQGLRFRIKRLLSR